MEKPITLVIKEFEKDLVNVLNNSKLPAWLMLDRIKPFISQLESLAQAQAEEDEKAYIESLKEANDGN